MDFSRVTPQEKLFLAGFVVVLMATVIFFGIVLTPWFLFRENPEFHDLMQRDKRTWPRCLLWHGWSPALDWLHSVGAWAVGPGRVAASIIESRLGG